MQHEMMRHPAPNPGSDNVGDVLASIRRLISQDGIPNQTLNALPAQDSASCPPIRPASSHRSVFSAQITPLVLDSSTLVTPESADGTNSGASTQTPPEPETVATAPDTQQFCSWPPIPAAETAATGTADLPDTEGLVADSPDPSLFADFTPSAIKHSGASLEGPNTTNLQMEETMLHANASVTPINPAAESSVCETGVPHIFASQDMDMQRGGHLRGMIREAIRQEIQGEIGNRLNSNLQQMIRHEIELTLRQMCEQD